MLASRHCPAFVTSCVKSSFSTAKPLQYMALQMLITTALLLLVCWTVWSGLYFAINHTFYQHQWSTHTTVHYFSLPPPKKDYIYYMETRWYKQYRQQLHRQLKIYFICGHWAFQTVQVYLPLHPNFNMTRGPWSENIWIPAQISTTFSVSSIR